MEPRIETLLPKKLVGKRIRMSVKGNRSYELWHGFMTRRKEITNSITTDLISMQVYDNLTNFDHYNPDLEFEKWAVTEVAGFDSVPTGMECYTLEGGLYAVFDYKGTPDTFPAMLKYIFGTWLPGSGYALDHREHFEILGEKYKRDDPESEEEVWIPVQKKA